MTCFRCKKELTSSPKPIATIFKFMAAFSLAPLHGGLWAMEEFSKEYCERCRRRVSIAAVTLMILVIGITVGVVRWLAAKGLLRFLGL